MTSVEGELPLTGTGRTHNFTLHERVPGQFREVSNGVGLLQQQVQEIAQKIVKMDQDNKDHFKNLYDRITDTSAKVKTVQRDMGTGGERLVYMVLNLTSWKLETKLHQVVMDAQREFATR